MLESPIVFSDRVQAGMHLAASLGTLNLQRPVILGIPRGGVIVAAEVARVLQAPLGILVVRKIGAPQNPELAIGAVSGTGRLQLDRSLIDHLGISESTLTALISEQQELACVRAAHYAGTVIDPELAGRTVVLVDDGLATGTTMGLAVQLVRQRNPARIVVAVPVGSTAAVALLSSVADGVICLMTPPDFHAVGACYTNFDEVTDLEVHDVLVIRQTGN